MSLVIYNTMSRKKETFAPLNPGEVRMYVCGPTVYDFLHIGNFRGAIFFNLVAKWLEAKGLKVTYVYNYTDVDDKIITRANEEGTTAQEISNRYIEEFEKDFRALGLRKHDHNPKVSEFIPQIVKFVGELVDNKKAYVVDGEVLYSVKSFDGYGKLSNKNTDELMIGARVEIDSKKQNPLDFALWKPAKPNEPKWHAPWCDGRPGWHIECSAMSRAILGEQIDIHGGGIDLIFPHHENEIAQTEGVTGKPFVKYWMHNNFINFGAQKMSKSLRNFTTGRKFLENYNPEILKYLILSAHYRSHSDFSEAPIQNTISQLSRIYSALAMAEELAEGQSVNLKDWTFNNPLPVTNLEKQVASAMSNSSFKALWSAIQHSRVKISESLDDDFNTPEVFAAIFDVIRAFNAAFKKGQKLNADQKMLVQHFRAFVVSAGELMALFQEPPRSFLITLDDMLLGKMNLSRESVNELVSRRVAARANKDFKTSDDLRAQLNQMGIDVQDTPAGTVWEVKKG